MLVVIRTMHSFLHHIKEGEIDFLMQIAPLTKAHFRAFLNFARHSSLLYYPQFTIALCGLCRKKYIRCSSWGSSCLLSFCFLSLVSSCFSRLLLSFLWFGLSFFVLLLVSFWFFRSCFGACALSLSFCSLLFAVSL